MIGDDVVMTIVEIRGDKVRVGFQAPQDLPIHRQEVYDAIQREKRRAQATQTPPVIKPAENDERKESMQSLITKLNNIQGTISTLTNQFNELQNQIIELANQPASGPTEGEPNNMHHAALAL